MVNAWIRLRKQDETTDFVNSVVLVEKSNGSLRVCLDLRNLNKFVKMYHYQLPTIENVCSQLKGAKIFSTLDATSGYWQVLLDEYSSKLCTFNTPFGRYCCLRLPFRISSAPEVFQNRMIKIFGDILGVIIFVDNILIFAKTKEEHDEILKKVLDRARKYGVKFNKEKCIFETPEIKCLGQIFNVEGMYPNSNKIKKAFLSEMNRLTLKILLIFATL